MPLIPASLAFTDDGTPYSPTFDDVYHSAEGGLGQAQHVFLAGNDLPRRWQDRERFVVLETGFGLGLNFLATWAAWRDDPLRCARLHFISCELHPFTVADLAHLHQRWPQFAELSTALRAQWPVLAPGLHRLHLDLERVTLTLYFGDARVGLAQIVAQADALYLDGFSPARNPALWSPKICHLLARLAAPDATLATWSVAGTVREHLRHAGFVVDKTPGFGGKRQMLRGRLQPQTRRNGRETTALQPDLARAASVPFPERHALIVGAGLAGCALSERLAARGWRIDLIDAADAPATGASGNLAGVLRPLPNIDDNRMSRLTRVGTLYGWRHIARLRDAGHAVKADACGVLHLARDESQARKMQAVVEGLALPPEHLRQVEAAEASALAGWSVPLGGWYFGDSGWVQPPSLCAANLAHYASHIRTCFGRKVARLQHDGSHWQAIDERGELIARAPAMVLTAGIAVRDFIGADLLPVVSARGQVSLLAAAPGSPPGVVVCRDGYVSPEVDGQRCAGATFSIDDEEEGLRETDHTENLTKLDGMLPGFTAQLPPTALDGRVGFRPASPDRLPMVGALPAQAALGHSTALADIPRQPGAYVLSGYGARGLAWSEIAAELLASQLEGDPLPLERELCEALDPARFLLRPTRGGRIQE